MDNRNAQVMLHMNQNSDVANTNILDKKTVTGKKSIMVFGEVLADIFPEKTILGGAPFNVARHLHAFKQHSILITRTGKDRLGRDLLAQVNSLGMNVKGIQFDENFPTGQVLVKMVGKEHRFEIVPDQAFDHIDAGMMQKIMYGENPDIAYFGTLAQRCIESRFALDTFLNDAKCPRFLDLNLRDPWYDLHVINRSLMHADVVKLNEHELERITFLFDLLGKNQVENGRYLVKKYNLNYLFVTCGNDGAWLITKNGDEIKTKTQNLGDRLVNTIGAGDGFSSVCILGLINNWGEYVILERANKFATALCLEQGATPEQASFYDVFIAEWGLQS